MNSVKKIFSFRWIFVAGLLLLIGCVFVMPAKEKNTLSLQAGEKLYADNCVQCHGVTGAGNGPSAKGLSLQPANLTHLGWKPDALLALKIREGNKVMPAWKNVLSDDQISSLVEYIRNFEPVN